MKRTTTSGPSFASCNRLSSVGGAVLGMPQAAPSENKCGECVSDSNSQQNGRSGEKIEMGRRYQRLLHASNFLRLGVPSLRMSDGHDGPVPRLWVLTTAYPAGIALAASWDVDLAERFGTGDGGRMPVRVECISILGPGNEYLPRRPMNGRNFEYFGEDPFLGREWRLG